MIKILGIDPSLRNLGLAIAEYHNNTLTITHTVLASTKPYKTNKTPQNILDLQSAKQLYNVLQSNLEGINIICVELPTGSQSSRANTSYGICIGLIASITEIPVIVVKPSEVKKIVGNITTSKKDIIEWVINKHPEAVLPKSLKKEHICDAIVAIYAGIQTKTFEDYLYTHY